MSQTLRRWSLVCLLAVEIVAVPVVVVWADLALRVIVNGGDPRGSLFYWCFCL